MKRSFLCFALLFASGAEARAQDLLDRPFYEAPGTYAIRRIEEAGGGMFRFALGSEFGVSAGEAFAALRPSDGYSRVATLEVVESGPDRSSARLTEGRAEAGDVVTRRIAPDPDPTAVTDATVEVVERLPGNKARLRLDDGVLLAEGQRLTRDETTITVLEVNGDEATASVPFSVEPGARFPAPPGVQVHDPGPGDPGPVTGTAYLKLRTARFAGGVTYFQAEILRSLVTDHPVPTLIARVPVSDERAVHCVIGPEHLDGFVLADTLTPAARLDARRKVEASRAEEHASYLQGVKDRRRRQAEELGRMLDGVAGGRRGDGRAHQGGPRRPGAAMGGAGIAFPAIPVR